MNAVGAGLLVTALAAVAGVATVCVVPRGRVPVAGGLAAAVAAAGGLAAGVAALAGGSWRASLPQLLPLSGLSFRVDALSGWFLLLIGLVGAAAAVFGIGYADRRHASRGEWAAFVLFAPTMLAVVAADDVGTFLLGWEGMALSSLVLVLAEHRHSAEVRAAGVWYAVMTHAGFVAVLAAFGIFGAAAGGGSFEVLRAAGEGMSPGARGTVFVLALAGFAAKAGAVPVHVWLPRAHPAAPSHVSAVMSGAMVKLGVYGLLRVGMDLLGPGPAWWGLSLLVVGLVSALYGVLQAAVASDLKRLLAYSTTENVGVILVALGAAGLYQASGHPALAAAALAAGLLHALNHAAFKGLLFLAAGAVLRGTGLRDLDRLGGLARRMPATAALFAVGALCAAALPPGNGFVGEWLLLQALVHGVEPADTAAAVVLPIAVAVVALTTGLAVAAFVKAYGVGFLARPRSDAAATAREAGPAMLAGAAGLGVACVVLGVAPTVVTAALNRAVAAVRGYGDLAPPPTGGPTLGLTGLPGSVNPPVLVAALLAAAALVVVLRRVTSRRPRRRGALLWGCGGTRLSPRMEYTATSYAEPLVRVFDDVLRPERDVDVTHHEESRYLVERVRYQHRLTDEVEQRLYRPLVAAVRAAGEWARVAHSGSVHRYLGYGAAALVVELVAVAVVVAR